MALRLKRFDSLKYYNYICIWERRNIKVRKKYLFGQSNMTTEVIIAITVPIIMFGIGIGVKIKDSRKKR